MTVLESTRASKTRDMHVRPAMLSVSLYCVDPKIICRTSTEFCAMALVKNTSKKMIVRPCSLYSRFM